MPSVMQVIYSFAIGGSEILALNIAKSMKKQEWESSLCAIEFGGALEPVLEKEGLSNIWLSRSTSPKVGSFLRMYKFFRQNRPDIVHTHHVYDLIYAIVPSILSGARIIHTEHEYYSLLGKKTVILRYLSHFCSDVTSVSEEVTEFLEKKVRISRNKLHTIRNGIDIEKFSGKSILSRQSIGVNERDFVIGVVARLEPVKNIETLIRAFVDLSNQRPNVSLVIVGDGSVRADLESLATDLHVRRNVHFLGARLDIADVTALFDVFVLPSHMEGLPISLLEAMSCGKPVIASDVGSISTVVFPGENGYLIEPNDAGTLSECLLRLMDDPDARALFGKHSRRIIEESYNNLDSMKAYLDLYHKHIS